MKKIKLIGIVLFTWAMSVASATPIMVGIRGFDTVLAKGVGMCITFLVIFGLLLFIRKKFLEKGIHNRTSISLVFVILMVLLTLVLQMALELVLQYFGLEIDKSNNTSILNILSSDDYWLMLLSLSVIAPILEEFIFRGLLQESLIQCFPKAGRLTIVISSFIFAYLHLYNLNIALVGYFISGYLFGYLYHRTRDLRYSILAHSLTNSIITIIYYIYLANALWGK